MGLGRCVVTHIICTIMPKKFHALWSLNFASGLLWQRSGHPIFFGSLGVKIMLWGSKTSKILTNIDYCLCSICRAQLLSYLFYI